MDQLTILAGLIALTVGAELLVRGASRLATAFGLSPLTIGLTVVAFGTSAPELAVSVSSTINGQADMALGNVLGSNIFNVLCILGLSALIVPLVVDRKLIRFDIPVMVVVSVLPGIFGLDGIISRADGGILTVGLLVYLTWCIVAAKGDSSTGCQILDTGVTEVHSGVPRQRPYGMAWQAAFILIGLQLLVLGANWFVDGATAVARRFGVNELVIGLTIVAGGTSLPELATSIVAAIRGERDIAVGNVVGSNIFNILGVLGLSAVAAPGGVFISDQAFRFDIPVSIAVCAACLPVCFTGHLIDRWEGGVFLGYYIAYLATLLLMATNSPSLPAFQSLMWCFVIPLTLVTLIIIVWRALCPQPDQGEEATDGSGSES